MQFAADQDQVRGTAEYVSLKVVKSKVIDNPLNNRAQRGLENWKPNIRVSV
jgi:hypothetical protein